MKIGIITFHRAHNYGAVLQCYALSKCLSARKHDVEVIDYYPDYFRKQYSSWSLSNFKGLSIKGRVSYLITLLLTYVTRVKRSKAFDHFISHLPLSSDTYNEINHVFNKYDAIIFGSDQIWNPMLTNGEDRVYSGNFDTYGAKLIAYAASTSPKVCTDTYKDYFHKIINRFNAISVREESLNTFINNIIPETSRVVLDPVLLLTQDDWSKVSIKPRKKKYLLIYTVPQSPKVWELARMIASLRQLDIIEIRPYVSIQLNKHILQDISPEEFIGYFQHASYIVTTSFHGTAFSLKFEKQFVTLKLGTAVDDRAANLLNVLGLSDRMIPHDNLFIPAQDIAYDNVNTELLKLIESSKEFIVNSL